MPNCYRQQAVTKNSRFCANKSGNFLFPFLVLKHDLTLPRIFVGRTSVYLLPRGCQTDFGGVTVPGAPVLLGQSVS